MKIAKCKPSSWPKITLPGDRGNITIQDVLKTPPGKERDVSIKNWCLSVWDAFSENQEIIRKFTQLYTKS